MKRSIELTVIQARKLLGQSPEMDKLIRDSFTEDELTPKPKLPMRWEHLKSINGAYILNINCSVSTVMSFPTDQRNRKVYPSQIEAVSYGRILPQLLQLRDAWRPKGWKADWNNVDQPKYCVIMHCGNLKVMEQFMVRSPLSFPTEQLATDFMNTHRVLLTEYFAAVGM